MQYCFLNWQQKLLHFNFVDMSVKIAFVVVVGDLFFLCIEKNSFLWENIAFAWQFLFDFKTEFCYSYAQKSIF